MSDDLVKRLRNGIIEHDKRWSGDTHADLGGSVDYDATENLMAEAAARIAELEGWRTVALSNQAAAQSHCARVAELEAAQAEAVSAWEAFKGATVSDDHFAAAARLDAALGITSAE